MQYGPGSAATFLYYFTSTALVFTLVTARSMDIGIIGLPQQVGLLGGLVGGLVGVYFNRTTTFSLSTNGRDDAFKTLIQKLEAMGYAQKAAVDNLLIYERSGLSRLVSGKVLVHLEASQATVASRALHIRVLKQLL